MTIKHDQEKLRPTLLPMEAVNEVIKVLEFGANKYSVDNWKTVTGAKQRYLDAFLRHGMSTASGDKLDAESDLSHMAHAVCCGLFYIWFELDEQKDKAVLKKTLKQRENDQTRDRAKILYRSMLNNPQLSI
jgi:hypothetical protein